MSNKYKRKRNKHKHRINEHIRSRRVRLVGDDVGNEICSLDEALSLAESKGLDLVEVNPNGKPPVCKAMDYNKYLYEQKKNKKKSKKVETKEIRFTPNTQQHDLDYRAKQASKFLKSGNKVKVSVFYKGRQIANKERGEVLLLQFVQMLEDEGVAESMPKMSGRRLEVTVKPK